jgi:translation initiation factor eIF-2B subunit epsilon
MKIEVYVAPEAFGTGDIIRELDRQSLIQSDFILVSGDVISNLKLDNVLEVHRQRRAINKDIIMTMVMKRGHPQHRSRFVP